MPETRGLAAPETRGLAAPETRGLAALETRGLAVLETLGLAVLETLGLAVLATRVAAASKLAGPCFPKLIFGSLLYPRFETSNSPVVRFTLKSDGAKCPSSRSCSYNGFPDPMSSCSTICVLLVRLRITAKTARTPTKRTAPMAPATAAFEELAAPEELPAASTV